MALRSGPMLTEPGWAMRLYAPGGVGAGVGRPSPLWGGTGVVDMNYPAIPLFTLGHLSTYITGFHTSGESEAKWISFLEGRPKSLMPLDCTPSCSFPCNLSLIVLGPVIDPLAVSSISNPKSKECRHSGELCGPYAAAWLANCHQAVFYEQWSVLCWWNSVRHLLLAVWGNLEGFSRNPKSEVLPRVVQQSTIRPILLLSSNLGNQYDISKSSWRSNCDREVLCFDED